MNTKFVRASVSILLYPFLFIRVLWSLASNKRHKPELHKLVESRQKELIQAYVDCSKDLDVTDGSMLRTALHLSAMKGMSDVSELLVASGASTQIKDREGFTPLCLAALRGHRNIVYLLAQDVDPADILGNIFSNNLITVRQYLKNGGDPNCEFGGLGSILYISASQGLLGMTQVLLEHGADANLFETNVSPLHIAAIKGHREIADLLLNYNADTNLRNGARSPLHDAIKENYIDIAEALLQHAADHSLHDGFPFGNTPLHEAALSGNTRAVQLLLDYAQTRLLRIGWAGRLLLTLQRVTLSLSSFAIPSG